MDDWRLEAAERVCSGADFALSSLAGAAPMAMWPMWECMHLDTCLCCNHHAGLYMTDVRTKWSPMARLRSHGEAQDSAADVLQHAVRRPVQATAPAHSQNTYTQHTASASWQATCPEQLPEPWLPVLPPGAGLAAPPPCPSPCFWSNPTTHKGVFRCTHWYSLIQGALHPTTISRGDALRSACA